MAWLGLGVSPEGSRGTPGPQGGGGGALHRRGLPQAFRSRGVLALEGECDSHRALAGLSPLGPPVPPQDLPLHSVPLVMPPSRRSPQSQAALTPCP